MVNELKFSWPMVIDSFQGEYRWLSNFWPCEVYMEGEKYTSVEHAYQAAKTLDKQMRAKIRLVPTPGAAKKLGNTVALRSDWSLVKLPMMFQLIKQKFSEPTLGTLLLKTGNAELIEGNNWRDTFWGVCNGKGANHLGRILTLVRDSLMKKDSFK